MERPQVTRERSSNFSQVQIDLLLDSLEACPQLIMGEIGGKIPTKYHQKLAWEAVAQKLSEDGPVRTGEQVRSKWIDLKYRTRQKVNRIKELEGTDEIPIRGLSKLDIRILSLLGVNPDSSDCISVESVQPIKALRFINPKKAVIIRTDDTSNDDHDSYKTFIEEVESHYSVDEESEGAKQVKISECISSFRSPRKRGSSSVEKAEHFEGKRRKSTDEESLERRRILAAQERMSADIYKIKLSVIEMKNNMNVYMSRIDQKFDKMIDLLAVALNVEPHDMES